MGCTPSQSSNCIIVGQRNQSPILEDNMKSISSAPKRNTSAEKNYYLEEDVDSQTEDYLQASMKSNTSQLSSKSSCGSWDSGVYELDEGYSHVITENSDPGKVREVDSQFVPKENLELIVEGKACPTRLSARDRDFKEQQAILELLREEGLIVRPPAKAVGGIRFELVSTQNSTTNETLVRKLPPMNIRKHKKVELTHEEIQKKLIQAEERRKKKIEERLNKMAAKDFQEIQAFAQQQTEKNKQKLEMKLHASTQSREKHLNEVQEKLKAKEEHAKQVRERKQMLARSFMYISPSETE
ncbi:hypothetical protein JTE90_021001 [Oedothorax gibbosus]|uniref:Uncharacterized protein n=1 Tax=Oedothorax gibbosus TaxID=931172 RepID=A0AAV6U4V6_9ARAC|nr:hypothetical protein JTE90_021001 [Oedothorax gibbosus]